jgi:predicted RNA-binding protein
MATTATALYRGAAATSLTTLYTVPADTTAVVNTIVVVNSDSSSATYDLYLDGVVLANDVIVPENDSAILEIKQVLGTTKNIQGSASATTVAFHISGIEIT